MNLNIKKEKHFLLFLVNADKTQTKLILKIMTKSQFEAVTSILYNILHGTFNIKREIVEGVRSYRKQLHVIVDKKIGASKRKTLMIRRAQEIVKLLNVAVKVIFLKNVIS